MMRTATSLAIAATLLGVAGCQTTASRAPDAQVIAGAYPLTSAVDRSNGADLAWKQVIQDPRLARLTEIALSDNRDLRLAVLDAEAARAQLRVSRSALFPQVEADGGMTRARQPLSSVAGEEVLTSTQYAAQVSVTAFELDLFGRLRAESRSAFETYLAASEGRDAARSAVISTVAEAYLTERAAAEQLALTEATLADWRTSLELASRLRSAGQSSGLEVAQAEAQVQSAEADLEAGRRALQQATNALVLAVGAPLPVDLPPPWKLADQPVMTIIPAGLPADLLERRPDVRQAEHLLAAANADIDAARAAFFPRISLTGLFGVASGDLDALFRGDSRAWSFAPQISAPIFTGGRLSGGLALAEIRNDRAVAQYERTIQTAFREVADGLAGRETFDRQIEAQTGAVQAAQRRVALSELRYRAGVDSRLELLDAQRQLYAARSAVLSLRQAQGISSVSLYRALGGGARLEEGVGAAAVD